MWWCSLPLSLSLSLTHSHHCSRPPINTILWCVLQVTDNAPDTTEHHHRRYTLTATGLTPVTVLKALGLDNKQLYDVSNNHCTSTIHQCFLTYIDHHILAYFSVQFRKWIHKCMKCAGMLNNSFFLFDISWNWMIAPCSSIMLSLCG